MSKIQKKIQTPKQPDGHMPVAWLAPMDNKGGFIPLNLGANIIGRGQTPSMCWHADRKISRKLGVLYVMMDSNRPLFVLTVLSKVFITKKNCVPDKKINEIRGISICEVALGDTISFLRTSHMYCLVWEPLNEINKCTSEHIPVGDSRTNIKVASVSKTSSPTTSTTPSNVMTAPARKEKDESLLPPRKKMRLSDSFSKGNFPQTAKAFSIGQITAAKVRKWASDVVCFASDFDHQLACDSHPASMLRRIMCIAEYLAGVAAKDEKGGLEALLDLGVLDALHDVMVESRCSWPPGWRVEPEQYPVLIAARPAFQQFQAVYPALDARQPSSVLGTVRYGDRVAKINVDAMGVTDSVGDTFSDVFSWMVAKGPSKIAKETAVPSETSARHSPHMASTSTAPRSNPRSKSAPCSSLQYGEFDFFSLACVLNKCVRKLVHRGQPFRPLSMVDLGSGCGKVVVAAALLCAPRFFSRIVGIELLPQLHEQAIAAARSHNQLRSSAFDSSKFAAFTTAATTVITGVNDCNRSRSTCPVLEFLCGDFLDHGGVGPNEWQWWEGGDIDLVFAHSTCFTSELMQGIAKRCLCLRPGSLVVTTSAPLHVFMPDHVTSAFKLLHQEEFWMPWGTATVFVQQRISLVDHWLPSAGAAQDEL